VFFVSTCDGSAEYEEKPYEYTNSLYPP
jgi:hypothetical protein